MSKAFAVTTVLVVVGSTEAKSIKDGKGLTIKPVIGGFLLGIALISIDNASPQLGTKFNWLMIIGALLLNGAALFEAITPKK